MIDYDFDVICDQPNDSSDEYDEDFQAYREQWKHELEADLPFFPFFFIVTITDRDGVDTKMTVGEMMVDDTTAPGSSDSSENRIRRSPEDLLFEPIDPIVKEEKKEQPVRDEDYAFDAGCYC